VYLNVRLIAVDPVGPAGLQVYDAVKAPAMPRRNGTNLGKRDPAGVPPMLLAVTGCGGGATPCGEMRVLTGVTGRMADGRGLIGREILPTPTHQAVRRRICARAGSH
jgi:hypothetical protein